MNKWLRYITVLAISIVGKSQYINDGDTYFKLRLKPNEKVGNIFSRAISYKGDGFKEVVNRVSGNIAMMDRLQESPP